MSLMCITGELGSGKTLSLTYFAYLHYYKKKRRIFSNYTLYGIPFTKIDTLLKLENMRMGTFVADELWLWLDRFGGATKSKLVSDILLKSRKRGLNYIFTSQTLDQVPKKVRKVIDFVAYPMLNPSETICKLVIFQGSNPSKAGTLKTIYFYTEPIYRMYSSTEEITPLSEKPDAELKEIYLPLRSIEEVKKEAKLLGKEV